VTEARRRSVAAGEGSGGELLPFDMVWDGTGGVVLCSQNKECEESELSMGVD
jgi:hypothetical protein